MYQAELDDARRALDQAEKEKARLEIRVATLETMIEELQAKLVFILVQCISDIDRRTISLGIRHLYFFQ